MTSNNNGEDGKTELQGFWGRVLAAVSRLVALGLFIGIHYLLNTALFYAVPSNMTGALSFAQDVIYVIFLLLYLYLAIDMFRVFIPALKRLDRQQSALSESDTE
jgi:hypothetical protein